MSDEHFKFQNICVGFEKWVEVECFRIMSRVHLAQIYILIKKLTMNVEWSADSESQVFHQSQNAPYFKMMEQKIRTVM